MSYCRFGWGGSDLYMFEHTDGGIECCWCQLVTMGERYGSVRLWTLDDTLQHIEAHRAAGHTVIDGLEDDIRRQNPFDDPVKGIGSPLSPYAWAIGLGAWTAIVLALLLLRWLL